MYKYIDEYGNVVKNNISEYGVVFNKYVASDGTFLLRVIKYLYISEKFSMSDKKSSLLNVSFKDVFNLSDAFNSNPKKTLSEVFSLSDSSLNTLNISLEDVFGLIDETTNSINMKFNDIFSLSDFKNKHLNIKKDETFSLSDGINNSLIKQFDDLIGYIDSITCRKRFFKRKTTGIVRNIHKYAYAKLSQDGELYENEER